MADGGRSKGCSRLCDLVGRSLRQHALALAPRGRSDEPLSSSAEEAAGAPPTLSKEAEKDLLIYLTVVCREIKRWTTEIEGDYEQANVVDPVFHGDCSCCLEPPFECQSCAANIISLLVVFLASNSQYVRHMAGKVLVAISNFLVQYVSKWEEFIRLLWISLQVAINSCASLCTSAESVVFNVVDCPHNKHEASTTTQGSNYDAHFVALLRSRLKNTHWLMPAALTQVLHIIQKSLRNEDGGLAESYLHFAVFSLLNVPWNLLSKIYAGQSSGSYITRSVVGGDLGKVESNGVFLGAVLQLLCSLVEQNDLEVGDSPLDESSVYFKFTNLVSELLVCCFSNCRRYTLCVYQYLRHKVLVLMIRLSFWSHWQCSALVSWLQLLHKYFKDILHQPIPRCHAGHNISMEGSPFLASINDEGKVENMCTTHLQRQTLFLFLKCCFALIRFDNQACHECTCGSVTSFTCELQKHGESCCFNGLSEISGWLRRHVPLEEYADDMNYLKSCRRFSLSFLQLYMDEDDLLFEVLLQLLDAPFPAMQGQRDKHDNLCEEMGKDISFHISNIFNPIHLFHLFLSLIHYDHSVLLDYLISKDTGIHFVQYVLRCVRLVCWSWLAFVEFSMCCTIGQPHSKRRKLGINGQDSSETLGLTFSATDDINDFRVLQTGDGKMHKFGSKQESSARPKQMFQDAKECLLSLKTCVEDLHRKNLFPYSPAPLLRSFTRFQELCEAEQSRLNGY